MESFERSIISIKHDTLNNQKANLRICSNSENCRNQKIRKTNSTGYKGVVFRKDNNKYRARIMQGDKYITIGQHENAIEAAKMYNMKDTKQIKSF